jgi:hypothetical protein
MSQNDIILNRIRDFNFTVKRDNWRKYKYYPIGIGDILNTFKLIKDNLIPKPIYFPLVCFYNTNIFPQPINALYFRCCLISELMKSNGTGRQNFIIIIPNEDKNKLKKLHIRDIIRNILSCGSYFIPKIFIKCKSLSLNHRRISITNFPKELLNKEYIIFHTKLRFHTGFNYNSLINNLNIFYKNLKTKYIIVLLGEKEFGNTLEGNSLNITTVYNQLLNLKKNNNVIDLTQKTIINQLNYQAFIKDISIMKYAKYNICCGLGGHFCSSLAFSNRIITFYSHNINLQKITNLNFFTDFNLYLSYITNILKV